MTGTGALTGAALEQALKSGELDRGGTELIGMVKASAQEGRVAFSAAGCEQWVDIPVGLIEQAERVGTSRCRDHTHPLFRLTLAEGEGEEAKVYAALLAAATASRTQSMPWGPAGPIGAAAPGAGGGAGYLPPGGVAPAGAGTFGFPGFGFPPWTSRGFAAAAGITYCRNATVAWAIDNRMCGECAEFRIVCPPGRPCRSEQVSGWRHECWDVEASAW